MQVMCHQPAFSSPLRSPLAAARWGLRLARLMCAAPLALACWAASPVSAANLPIPANSGALNLYEAARQWLAQHERSHPEQITIAPLDDRLHIPECAGGWSMDLPFNNSSSVRARCASSTPPAQFFLRAQVQALQQEVVSVRNLPMGSVLQASDLRLAMPAPGRQAAMTSVDNLLGRELRASVSAGTPFTQRHLKETVTLYRLRDSRRAGEPLKADQVEALRVPFTEAPAQFWSGPWPEQAALGGDRSAGHILRQSDWQAWETAVVATVDLPRGARITPAMLKLTTLPANSLPNRAATALADVLHSETLREVRQGQPLSKLDVRAAVLVKRGALVLISVGEQGGFQISTRVEAQQDGRLGEQIRLKNLNSGRIISGVVTDLNAVRGL